MLLRPERRSSQDGDYVSSSDLLFYIYMATHTMLMFENAMHFWGFTQYNGGFTAR